MNDQLIRDLLHEVADEVEPGDRLDAIRAATHGTVRTRRGHRGWWAAGGASLVAASVATVLALTTGGAPQGRGADPAAPTPSRSSATDPAPATDPLAVYLVGETAAGPRLFREFRPDLAEDLGDDAEVGSRAVSALDAALRGDALDPDYRSPWPAGTSVRSLSPDPEGIEIILDRAPVRRPAGMSETEARLALEQLVRTAQAAVGAGRVPVDVQVSGAITDTLLGVPTTAPLTGSPDADVLAPVSLSDPSEGLTVDNDDAVVIVRGRAWSGAGEVTTRVQRWEGTAVLVQEVDRLTADVPGMVPFTASLDLSNAPPGDYDVISTVQDADGTTTSDTRRITVVD